MSTAPKFHLTAVGAARMVGGPPGIMPLLLLFHGANGAELATEINTRLRQHFPDPDELLIASIVDLHHVPGFMRAPARFGMETAYYFAARKVPSHLKPADFIYILPDWDGRVTQQFQMTQCAEGVGLALITPAWEIVAAHAGKDVLGMVPSLIPQIRAMQPASV